VPDKQKKDFLKKLIKVQTRLIKEDFCYAR